MLCNVTSYCSYAVYLGQFSTAKMNIFHYNKTVANKKKKCHQLWFKGTLFHLPQYHLYIIMGINIASAFHINCVQFVWDKHSNKCLDRKCVFYIEKSTHWSCPLHCSFLKASLVPEVLGSKYEGSCLEGNILISWHAEKDRD